MTREVPSHCLTFIFPEKIWERARATLARCSFYVYEHLQKWLSRDPVVMDHPSDGQHGQPPVLEFLQLQLVHLFLALALEPFKGEPQISRLPVRILEHGVRRDPPLIRPPLLEAGESDDLHHAAHPDGGGRHVTVVHLQVAEHGQREVFGSNETHGGKHGHAAMLDLGLLQPLEVGVRAAPHFGEAEGIKTHAADEAISAGGVAEEGEGLGHLNGVRAEGGGGLVEESRLTETAFFSQ